MLLDLAEYMIGRYASLLCHRACRDEVTRQLVEVAIPRSHERLGEACRQMLHLDIRDVSCFCGLGHIRCSLRR